jgi:hypothetical protein
VPADPPANGPATPPTNREWPLGVVLAGVALGLVVVVLADFRRGVSLIALAVGLGAALRLTLPLRRCGLLAVRSRGLDVAVLLVLALGTLLLGLVVPPSD